MDAYSRPGRRRSVSSKLSWLTASRMPAPRSRHSTTPRAGSARAGAFVEDDVYVEALTGAASPRSTAFHRMRIDFTHRPPKAYRPCRRHQIAVVGEDDHDASSMRSSRRRSSGTGAMCSAVGRLDRLLPQPRLRPHPSGGSSPWTDPAAAMVGNEGFAEVGSRTSACSASCLSTAGVASVGRCCSPPSRRPAPGTYVGPTRRRHRERHRRPALYASVGMARSRRSRCTSFPWTDLSGDRQDDLADVVAGLDDPVRLGRVRQAEDAIHHRTYALRRSPARRSRRRTGRSRPSPPMVVRAGWSRTTLRVGSSAPRGPARPGCRPASRRSRGVRWWRGRRRSWRGTSRR